MMELFTYTVFSLVFNTSYKLDGPTDAGLNAKMFVYSEKNNEMFSLTFALFSKESQQSMAMNDAELLSYFKSTFMGVSKPTTGKKERNILNKISEGELLSTKIPVNSNLEIHLISLENGDKICIGFKVNNEMNENIKEEIISEILNTLKK